MKQEPLPQIYHVKDTDIPRFAYMLHVLAGDFLRESEFNMRTLATEVQPDTIAIMGKNHMWLHDAPGSIPYYRRPAPDDFYHGIHRGKGFPVPCRQN